MAGGVPARGLSGRPYLAVLSIAVLAAAAFLATHAPFAFSSPDGSYHAAKLLRAREGEPFLDPFAGTPSLYPAFFHWFYGSLGRALGLEPLRLYSIAGVADFVGLVAAFFLLARSVLGTSERAALAALALPLLFYAPSGRHILVANPANLGIPILFAGAALLVRSQREQASRAWLVAGAFLVLLAANVVWYLALPAAALLVVAALQQRLWREPRALAGTIAVALLPCLFTAWHFSAIRDVLPAYRGFGPSLSLGPDVIAGWATALFEKGNARFSGVAARSPLVWLHYVVGVLPFALFVAWATARRTLRRELLRPASRLLLAAGALTLLLSLALATTGDFPRVVSVQFAGWSLLALPALEWLLDARGHAAAGRAAVTAMGLVGLAATVLHTERPFEAARPTEPTRAVIELVQRLPGHAHERIWASEAHLRELAAFVTFTSFVNHVEGRYHNQDPESSARLLAAYRTIRDRAPGWREALTQERVRYLAVRHSDPVDREVGLFYLQHGRPALQNREWWVVDVSSSQ